ncbi:MAG TPA: 4Fe-4S binding protein, partial [Bacillota bacterium]|nr:4Fe-4S binding protein [Bacillota bacterium]
LGGLSGNYARSGMIELRATREKCQKCTVQACFKGGENAPGCPMFEFPATMDTNARCNLCGHCVKNCPNDSLVLKYVPPTKELWFIRRPKLEEAMLAAVIMGMVFVQNVSMLAFWQGILDKIAGVTGTEIFAVNFTIAFLAIMAIPALLLVAAGAISNIFYREGLWKNVARFGYALIPLDLAGHFAHNLFHLLAEGLAVYKTFLGMFGIEFHGSMAVFSAGTIQLMQFALVGLGVVGSLYTAYRIAKSSGSAPKGGYLPYAALMLIIGLINIVLFYLPMAMRM